MIASFRNNPKQVLDSFFIKNFLQSLEHNGKHMAFNPDDSNEEAHIDEERLQEWRKHMFQVRNVKSDIEIN